MLCRLELVLLGLLILLGSFIRIRGGLGMGMSIRLCILGRNISLMWKINLLLDSNFNGNARC